MNFNLTVKLAVAALPLAISLGCACAPNRCTEEVPSPTYSTETSQSVRIGGSVYQPGTLGVEPKGLTLREAIHAVGGVRQPPQVQETTSNPAAVANVQELTNLSRTQGGLSARQRILRLPNESAAAKAVVLESTAEGEELQMLITQRIKDLGTQIDELQNRIQALVKELSTSFEEEMLSDLSNASRQVGIQRERAILFENPAFRTVVSWNQEAEQVNLRNATSNEAGILEDLYDARGKTTLRTLQRQIIVRLDRATVDPPVSLFVPYELITSGVAGDIALRDGDLVNVLDISETPLSVDDGETTLSDVTVQGLVESPGPVENAATVGMVTDGAPLATTDARGVWVLARPDASGRSLLLFVLPSQLVGPNGAAADARALPGDVYTYALLPMVPLIFDSQMERVLNDVKRRCLDRVREKKEQHRQERHQHVDQFHDRLHNCLQHIPGL